MAAALVSNPVSLSGGSGDSAGKKKKRNRRSKNSCLSENNRQWKSESQQKVYSSKLVQAIDQIKIASSRAVRDAADRILATAARGKTKWSRAILANCMKLKFRNHKRRRAPSSADNRLNKPRVGVRRLKRKCSPAVQRKVRVLRRLIPGCRNEPLPVILEEVSDFIAALEMQVRAMSALAGVLSGDTSGSGSTSPPHRGFQSQLFHPDRISCQM